MTHTLSRLRLDPAAWLVQLVQPVPCLLTPPLASTSLALWHTTEYRAEQKEKTDARKNAQEVQRITENAVASINESLRQAQDATVAAPTQGVDEADEEDGEGGAMDHDDDDDDAVNVTSEPEETMDVTA